jgi:hypothetical protein
MNFHELTAKLKAIDEGKSLEECGGVMIGGPAMAPKQADNVSMNVTMTGQGTQGVRDLMDVIRAIEQGVEHGDHKDVLVGDEGQMEPMGPGPDVDEWSEIGPDHPSREEEEGMQPMGPGPDHAVDEVQGDDHEAWGNTPQGGSGHHTHGLPAVTMKGDDMNSKGGESPLSRERGTNPLVNRLSSMYEEIKAKKTEAYNPNSSAAQHAREMDKHDHDRLKAAAEKDGASDADKARYKRYQDKKAAVRAAYDARMER